MHYLGKPGPITLRGEGWSKGGAEGRRSLSRLTLYFFPFSSAPHPSLLRCKRWTALYSVSTGPCSQIRELLMELSSVLVYLVPSHQVQVSLLYRWTQRARAMSYPRSTRQPKNNTRAQTTNTIFLLPEKLSNACVLERQSNRSTNCSLNHVHMW